MRITNENYRNFYFGSAAELFVQSEFYTFGFEAYKTQPDIGFDICATNNALVTFCSCERKTFNIQVKARLVNAAKTDFIISAQNFEMLKNDETSILVCVLGFPRVDQDWNTFDYANYRESFLIIDRQIEWDGIRHLLSQDTRLSVNQAEEKYHIVGYNKKYFWLHNKHIKRLLNDGYFEDYEFDGVPYKRINIIVGDDDSISFYRDAEDSADSVVNEIQSIKYLVDEKTSTWRELNQGKLFMSDIF